MYQKRHTQKLLIEIFKNTHWKLKKSLFSAIVLQFYELITNLQGSDLPIFFFYSIEKMNNKLLEQLSNSIFQVITLINYIRNINEKTEGFSSLFTPSKLTFISNKSKILCVYIIDLHSE